MRNDLSAQRVLFQTIAAIVAVLSIHVTAVAQVNPNNEAPEALNTNPMTAQRLGELILNVDDEAQFNGSAWAFHVGELDVAVIYDIQADRMRIIIPIGPADGIPADELVRLMQANFDSALDARYAIAQDKLWGIFIHPLSELSDEEFLVAIGETANIVMTFGTSYSSGMFIFNGGDSAEIQQRDLIDELKKKTI